MFRTGVIGVDQCRETLRFPGFRHWLSLRAPLPEGQTAPHLDQGRRRFLRPCRSLRNALPCGCTECVKRTLSSSSSGASTSPPPVPTPPCTASWRTGSRPRDPDRRGGAPREPGPVQPSTRHRQSHIPAPKRDRTAAPAHSKTGRSNETPVNGCGQRHTGQQAFAFTRRYSSMNSSTYPRIPFRMNPPPMRPCVPAAPVRQVVARPDSPLIGSDTSLSKFRLIE